LTPAYFAIYFKEFWQTIQLTFILKDIQIDHMNESRDHYIWLHFIYFLCVPL